MRFKLRLPDSTEVINLDAKDDSALTVGDLICAITDKVGPFASVKGGYPPKPVPLDNPGVILGKVGIRSGDQLVVGGIITSAQSALPSDATQDPRSTVQVSYVTFTHD
jgi:hypothetical protein